MQLIPIPVLINGNSYSWSDIQISINGALPLIGCTELNYGFSRKVTNNYGAGSQPVSRSYGNVEYTASVTIYKEELEVIKSIAIGGDITTIPPFTISVSYMNQNLPIVTEKLLNCSFANQEIKVKQNDANMPYSLTIVFAGLQNF